MSINTIRTPDPSCETRGTRSPGTHSKGFTLIAMLLLLTLFSAFLVVFINFSSQKADQLRRDKTALQMQQILNSALSYYLSNSSWPVTTCGTWQDPTTFSSNNFNSNFINGFTTNPYGQAYSVTCATQNSTGGGNYFLATRTDNPANAMIVAGRLPMAFINSSVATTQTDASCRSAPFTNCNYVITSVNIPGQNLANARSVNFAGLFYSGSCVPAPSCPFGMRPSIIVIPAGVAGIMSAPTCSATGDMDPETCTAYSAYPVSSFNAFARGKTRGDDTPGDPNGSNGSSAPLDCNPSLSSAVNTNCWSNDVVGNRHQTWSSSSAAGRTLYWRVCLMVTTESGYSNPITFSSAQIEAGKIMGQIAAFTRCVPNDGSEAPSGSQNVYQFYPYP